MTALGSEKEGWHKASTALAEAQEALVGDCVLAACSLAYLGPFEASYRQELVDDQWRSLLGAASTLKASPVFDLREALGTSEKIANWQLQGLPDDRVSTENVLIMEETLKERWPLMIDPQE